VVASHKPLAGHVWSSFAALLVALVPALLFLARWRERSTVVLSGPRAREAEELVSVRGRELEAVAAISNALARTHDPYAAGRVLLDEVASVLGVEFTALAVIDESGKQASGLLARSEGRDLDWWREVRLDLINEPSGISSAYFDAAPVVVYDVGASSLVSPRLVAATGAKSGAFVPLIVEERVVGVLVVAPTRKRRAFTAEEVTLMQGLAAEAAIALERTRSAGALDEALERERVVAEISRRVRSVHDLDEGSRIAVEEIARALRAQRCFIRLGAPGERLPLQAEWHVETLEPLSVAAERLPASNLAARERKTVAIDDIETAPDLADPNLGGRETLTRLGSRAVLATPIVAFDRMIGVLALHRIEPVPWAPTDIALAEAVARELGLAIHSVRLLDENQRRLAQQKEQPAAVGDPTSVGRAPAEDHDGDPGWEF
jgi:GAF domain-containing protein